MSGTYNRAGTIRTIHRFVAVMPNAEDPYKTSYLQLVQNQAGRNVLARPTTDITCAFMADNTAEIIIQLRQLPNGVPKEFSDLVGFQRVTIAVDLDEFFTAPMPK